MNTLKSTSHLLISIILVVRVGKNKSFDKIDDQHLRIGYLIYGKYDKSTATHTHTITFVVLAIPLVRNEQPVQRNMYMLF